MLISPDEFSGALLTAFLALVGLAPRICKMPLATSPQQTRFNGALQGEQDEPQFQVGSSPFAPAFQDKPFSADQPEAAGKARRHENFLMCAANSHNPLISQGIETFNR